MQREEKSLECSATHRSHARAGKLNYQQDGNGSFKSGSIKLFSLEVENG
jgi:hypothetical protein